MESLDFSPAEVSAYYRIQFPRLRQSGKRWRGPCPLHNGKSNSFSVDSLTGQWFCHSKCGIGGGIVSLHQAITGGDFKKSIAEIFSLIGRSPGSFTPIPKRELMRRRALEENAKYFSIGTTIMCEWALDTLSSVDPERRIHTLIIQNLREDPVAEYLEWKRKDRRWAAALVMAGRKHERRNLKRIEKTFSRIEAEESNATGN